MHPFPRGYNPSHRRPFSRVPRSFNSDLAYLATMEANTMAELSANVRGNQEPGLLHGNVLSREGGGLAWVELTGLVGERALSKVLLQSPAGTFHIVMRHDAPKHGVPEVEHHQVLVDGLSGFFGAGEAICLRDFGYVGDAVSSASTPAVGSKMQRALTCAVPACLDR